METNAKSRHSKSIRLYNELEETAHRLFDQVRRESGQFKTGACEIQGKKVLFLNVNQSIDERIEAIAQEISRLLSSNGKETDPIGVNNIFLKPSVRQEVERWADTANSLS